MKGFIRTQPLRKRGPAVVLTQRRAGAGQWEVDTGPQLLLLHLLCTRRVGESGRGARVGVQQSLSSLAGIISKPSPTHSFFLHTRAKFVISEIPGDLILVCIELFSLPEPLQTSTWVRLGLIFNLGGNWSVSEQLSATYKEMWLAGDTSVCWTAEARESSLRPTWL